MLTAAALYWGEIAVRFDLLPWAITPLPQDLEDDETADHAGPPEEAYLFPETTEDWISVRL